MFETSTLHTRVSSDGRVHVDFPASLPPDTEVDVTVSIRRSKKFESQEEWEAFINRIAGSIPDLALPEPLELRDVEPF